MGPGWRGYGSAGFGQGLVQGGRPDLPGGPGPHPTLSCRVRAAAAGGGSMDRDGGGTGREPAAPTHREGHGPEALRPGERAQSLGHRLHPQAPWHCPLSEPSHPLTLLRYLQLQTHPPNFTPKDSPVCSYPIPEFLNRHCEENRFHTGLTQTGFQNGFCFVKEMQTAGEDRVGPASSHELIVEK